MPFDSLVLPDTRLDPLLRLGITPIPQETVTAYKKAYKQAYLRVYTYLVGDRNTRWHTLRQGTRPLARFLGYPYERCSTHYGRIPDETSAPAALVDLAERVRLELPDATFTVDYFRDDPVLQVEYQHDGKRVKACLGIWLNGKIKMIASVT